MLDPATASPPSIFDRTLSNLRRVWRDLAGSGGYLPTATDGDLGDEAIQALGDRLQACLDARGGEVSARARAAELGEFYLNLKPQGRMAFLRVIATRFDLDHEAAAKTAQAYVAATDPKARAKLETALREALTAPRLKLLTQFTSLPQGVKFLVDMRADLLAGMDKDKDLKSLDADLRQLLSAWFDVGFLDLTQVTWDSPASLLEKLIAYEAVHQIRSWDDLHNRLDRDRRIFAFFHPRMPVEPLIFVQVALVKGVADNVQVLLDEKAPASDPDSADTAIFYSISNAQVGLRGIAFGNFLIKKVVDSVARDFPGIETYATLSPLPGFRRWLKAQEIDSLTPLLPARKLQSLTDLQVARAVEGDFRALLELPNWVEDAELAAALKDAMKTLCAQYLLRAKDGNNRPLDPVARFHLGNGAVVDRINWLGDRSAKGLKESHGMMVNYRYRLNDIETNHEVFAEHGTIVASDAVRNLLPRGRESISLAERAKFSIFGGAQRN